MANVGMEVAIGAASAGTVGATTGYVMHTIRKRNRVAPGTRSPAPISWLWSWRMAARLHRHLARTIHAVHACIVDSREQLGLATMVKELEAQACAIDRQLVAVDRSPNPTRYRMLRELYAEVRQVDAVAERVIRMGRAWAGDEPSVRGLAGVSDRLDALEAAMADLARLDRTAGPAASEVGRALRDGDQPVERPRRPPVVDRRYRRFER
jgi:hypothetical protein